MFVCSFVSKLFSEVKLVTDNLLFINVPLPLFSEAFLSQSYVLSVSRNTNKALHVEGQSVLSLVLVKGQRTVDHSKTESSGTRLGLSS